jgi:hypothetical protein
MRTHSHQTAHDTVKLRSYVFVVKYLLNVIMIIWQKEKGKMRMSNITCGCSKGHASSYDSLCCFCREKLFGRAVAKSVGVRHRGDGMSVEQLMSIEKKRGK